MLYNVFVRRKNKLSVTTKRVIRNHKMKEVPGLILGFETE